MSGITRKTKFVALAVAGGVVLGGLAGAAALPGTTSGVENTPAPDKVPDQASQGLATALGAEPASQGAQDSSREDGLTTALGNVPEGSVAESVIGTLLGNAPAPTWVSPSPAPQSLPPPVPPVRETPR
jgi:hypothetical protein